MERDLPLNTTPHTHVNMGRKEEKNLPNGSSRHFVADVARRPDGSDVGSLLPHEHGTGVSNVRRRWKSQDEGAVDVESETRVQPDARDPIGVMGLQSLEYYLGEGMDVLRPIEQRRGRG